MAVSASAGFAPACAFAVVPMRQEFVRFATAWDSSRPTSRFQRARLPSLYNARQHATHSRL
eukprot:1022707-Prorocentrum_minimum.AAC.1